MSQIMALTRHVTASHQLERVVPAFAAALLGMFILYGVGFAQPAAIHNAAHDSRHAIAFPCH